MSPLTKPNGINDHAIFAYYEERWREAYDEPVGRALICNNREAAEKVRQHLYLVRAKLRDNSEDNTCPFDELTISVSPHSGEILYVYRQE